MRSELFLYYDKILSSYAWNTLYKRFKFQEWSNFMTNEYIQNQSYSIESVTYGYNYLNSNQLLIYSFKDIYLLINLLTSAWGIALSCAHIQNLGRFEVKVVYKLR